jgi:hypothetical protein
VQPIHRVRVGFGARDVERGSRRIDRRHVDVSSGELAGEGSRAASDIEHRVGAQLDHHVDVHVEVGAVRVERVVDPGQSRVLEHGVGHPPILTREPRRRLLGRGGVS